MAKDSKYGKIKRSVSKVNHIVKVYEKGEIRFMAMYVKKWEGELILQYSHPEALRGRD